MVLRDAELFGHFGLPEESTRRTLGPPVQTVDAEDLTRRLTLAVEAGHESLVRLLLDAGADVNRRNTRGVTPLYSAARAGRREIAASLLGAGALVDASCAGDGRSALHGAAHAGETELVSALLAAGANAGMRSSSGETPLHLACSRGRVGAVRLLIAARA
ncbi:hypothetical protein EMIHUDRAFT_62696, partial [Emiliania huxleyi CCMP1516]|uniref:Ankyrin repeat domain-containing protein n=2 Tax=Emiliania huxleyi TaxID=2903 RepID=A0A0D3IL56_EMIH1